MSFRDWAFMLMILGLFFLFTGEPDLWDALHERAMSAAKESKCATN